MVAQSQSIRWIRPEALMALMDENQPVTVLDVRDPEGYFSSPLTILGAYRYPPDQIDRFYQQLPRDRLVVVVCDSPHQQTSTRVAQFLASHGFADVRVLEGGFNAWEALEYPTQPRNLAS